MTPFSMCFPLTRLRPCGGARWISVSLAGPSASPLSYPFCGHRGAGAAFDFVAFVGSELPPIIFARNLCRVAVLYDRGKHNLCLSATRTERSAPLSYVGISSDSRTFRGRGGSPAGVHLQKR